MSDEIGVQPPASFIPPSGTPVLRRKHEAVAEVSRLRHSEMQSISDRLARCSRFPWASMWITLGTLSGGALVGGALGLIPFYATHPSHHWRLIYFVSLAIVTLITALAIGAALTTHRERAESIREIKADYDKNILGTFELVSGGEGQPHAVGGEPGGENGEDG